MNKEELSLLFTSIIQRTADLSVGSKNMETCIKKARITLGVLLAKDKLKNLQLGITRDNDIIVWFDNVSREILFQFDL
jgi:outer membrane protein assembly factor BamE (lipoprotein component of BamABCDE complex)